VWLEVGTNLRLFGTAAEFMWLESAGYLNSNADRENCPASHVSAQLRTETFGRFDFLYLNPTLATRLIQNKIYNYYVF
jgi:hypothetical protein